MYLDFDSSGYANRSIKLNITKGFNKTKLFAD